MRSNKRSGAVQRAVLETLEQRRLLSLAAPVAYPVTPDVRLVATGDFNGDGRSDVVFGSGNGANVGMRLSNADGTLQTARNVPEATGYGLQSIAVADVNNDGKADLVTANPGLRVFVGNGNGTFQPALNVALPPVFPPGYTGTEPPAQWASSVVAGDLTGDGKLDLAVGVTATWSVPYTDYWGNTYWRTQYQGYVDVLIGNGNGAFGSGNSYADVNSYNPLSIALGDFNGDNQLDVVTGGMAVRLGNGNGTLQPPVRLFEYPASAPLVGDFDNDGKLDLIAAGVSFLKGQGNGTFANPVHIPSDADQSVVAGDVNADGKLDLIVSAQRTTWGYSGPYGVSDPTTTNFTQVLLGYGDGTFAGPQTITLSSHPDEGTPNVSALGDFNADGRPDLVASYPATMIVQLNEGGWVLPGMLTIGDVTVTEGNAGAVNAHFTVTLAAAPAGTVTVDYGTADGTAVAGDDFTATSGTLTFAPGSPATRTITVPVKGDRVGELNEEFYVKLTNAMNADLIDEQGTVTIVDDEPRVSINSASVTVPEGNTGTTTTPATFTVTLSPASDVASTVKFSASTYVAVSGKDFVPTSGTLTFLPGQTSKTLSVPARGDVIDEYDEVFKVDLTEATNAMVTGEPGTGIITDDDPLATIGINDVRRGEGNSGLTPFTFTISLLTPSEKYVDVAYATADGTAVHSTQVVQAPGADYAETSYPSLGIFGSDTQSETVTVYVIGDTRKESDETFFLNLSDPDDVIIADAQGVGTIVNDESLGKTWIGPASGGSWSTASNWSPSGVPTASSVVTISGASVTLASSASVAELSLTNGATLAVAPNGSRVLRTPALFVDYPSTLNLTDNDLIVQSTATNRFADLATTTARIKSGLNLGGTLWAGAGISTSLGGNGATGFGALGIIANDKATVGQPAGPIYTLFAGQTVGVNDVLVKYTRFGDPDLDGAITTSDYFQIDNGFLAEKNGWINGDFDYSGSIGTNDYFLIDNAFLNQSQQPAPSPPSAQAVFAKGDVGQIALAFDDREDLVELV